MAITGIIDTDLSEEGLDQDALVANDLNQLHGIELQHGYLVLDGYLDIKSPRTSRATSLDLNTGRLYVGNIQLEESLMDKLYQGSITGKASRQIYDYDLLRVRARIMFELERIFKRGPTTMILRDILADGELSIPSLLVDIREEFNIWWNNYLAQVEVSVTGKPSMEADFKAVHILGRGRLVDPSRIYGAKVFSQLLLERNKIAASIILSFEEFTRGSPSPRFNNFVLFFITKGIGPLYRENPFFQRFLVKHPVLEQKLREGLMSLDYFSSETVSPYFSDLYEAYKIMKQYGVNDADLFG